MRLKLVFFIVIALSLFSCEKQRDTIDVDRIISLQEKGKRINDSTLYYLTKSKALIESTKNTPDSIKAENDFLFGNYYNSIKKIDSAYYHYNNAIQYSTKEINTQKEKNYYTTLAYTYKINGDYLNSLSILDKLESGIENQEDYATLAEINKHKQSIYKLLKNFKKVIKYNKKAIKYFALAKDTSQLVNSLILQSSLQYYYFRNKKETYKLLDSLLTIKFQPGIFKNILNNQIYQNYGIFKYYDGNYQESYNNYHKAIQYLKNPKTKTDSLGLANTYANITEVLIELKKYNLAKKYTDSVDLYSSVLSINLKDFHLQNKLRLSYETKSSFNDVALNLIALKSNMNSNYEKHIDKELTALKEANKKEKELLVTNQTVSLNNAKLKRKQILLFSVLGFLLLSGLIAFLFYRQKKLKQEKEEIFMQQRLFRAQMNPHFTSNILFTIQDLILENKEKANKYLMKFSRLLRLNLENSMQNYTLIEKEIEVLSKYLDLQQLRFPDKFDYEIDTNNLEIDLLSIPPMLIQPFVENAIEHGFKNTDYKGLIKIDLSEKGKFIFCKITDNGKGLSTSNSKENHRSASTLLIKKLLKNMINQEVVIQNNKTEKGTSVTFNIPFKEV